MKSSILGLAIVACVAPSAPAQMEWELERPDPLPSARSLHALAYDAARQVTVLFGGFDEATGLSLNDTWTWDGTEWTERFPASSPEPGSGHALVFCPLRGSTILFGGMIVTAAGSVLRTETWEWDGEDWRVITTRIRPGPRFEAAMAYDERRGVAVLWGGAGAPTDVDTWEFDGVNWIRRAVTPPSSRQGFAVAYDPVRERVILYGGFRTARDRYISLNDMWEWDGATWTERVGGAGPFEDFVRPSLVYDPVRSSLLLFVRNLWEWNDAQSRWIRIETASRPAPRVDSALAFDVRRGRTVLFGGRRQSRASRDTWELSSQIVTSVTPAWGSEGGNDVVTVRGFGFGPASETVVRFGGRAASIEDVQTDAIRVRTPAGGGEADVEVSGARGVARRRGAFEYADPAIVARHGNVNVGSGDREDVLFVNESAGATPSRELSLAVGDPIAVTMRSPSSRLVAPFALYLWRDAPSDRTLDDSLFDIGLTVFPTPLSSGSPQPRAIWMNIRGHEWAFGEPRWPSSPAPSTVVASARGASRPVTFTLQGFIRDDASGSGRGLSVTNGVIVRVE